MIWYTWPSFSSPIASSSWKVVSSASSGCAVESTFVGAVSLNSPPGPAAASPASANESRTDAIRRSVSSV